jgi:DNA-binding XRE family transcriptional regulator
MSRENAPDDDSDSEERSSRRANPVDVHVGSRVRLRRMLLGMSQEKLGEHLGLTFQQIQKYEKGINRIGASRLFDLSKVLAVPVQFFYEELPVLCRRRFGSRRIRSHRQRRSSSGTRDPGGSPDRGSE